MYEEVGFFRCKRGRGKGRKISGVKERFKKFRLQQKASIRSDLPGLWILPPV